MLATLARRAAQQASSTRLHQEAFRIPVQAKRSWPPDFSKISTKQQFRLERKYKRRSKLKWARPGWIKGVKIAQYTTITFVVIYSTLFLDWNVEEGHKQPFYRIREWFFGLTGPIWSRDDVRRKPSPDDASPVSQSTA